MKFFFRAIRISLRYKWSIVAAVFCAMAIALLWSASLSTIFPFAKMVFSDDGQGNNLIGVVDKSLEDKQQELVRLNSVIAELESDRESAQPADFKSIDQSINTMQTQLAYESQQVQWLQDIRPYVVQYAPEDPFHTLLLVVAWLLIATTLKGIFLICSTMLVARVANRTVLDMRRIYFQKALEIDQIRVDRKGTSSLMTHLSHNMLLVGRGISAFYGKAIREPMKMIACLAVAAWISLPLLLISLIFVPLGALFINFLSGKIKKATRKEMGGMAAVFQTLIESFGSIKTVRIFNREKTERRRFKKSANTLYKMIMRMSFYDSLVRPFAEVLGIASISIALMAGAYLVLSGETHIFGMRILKTKMDPGMLLLFYAMLAGASDPARKMSQIINLIIRGGTACEKLFKAFDKEPDIRTPENPLPVPVHSESIEFKNVTFSYVKGQRVLRCLNLRIPFGQTLAIVGGNGSGKSTLTNLLPRFYDPNAGSIELDGVDIRKVRPKTLRQQMAWVTQDAVLFRGTVKENIEYGAMSVSRKKFREAIRISGVDQFLDKLERGLNSDIGDRGKLLSAGQRQRVAIARAIVADPRILILDEATSQLDGNTESLVHNELQEFLKNRTTIIITHRASSLKLADRVIVMDSGRIVADSPPELAGDVPAFNHLFAKSA